MSTDSLTFTKSGIEYYIRCCEVTFERNQRVKSVCGKMKVYQLERAFEWKGEWLNQAQNDSTPWSSCRWTRAGAQRVDSISTDTRLRKPMYMRGERGRGWRRAESSRIILRAWVTNLLLLHSPSTKLILFLSLHRSLSLSYGLLYLSLLLLFLNSNGSSCGFLFSLDPLCVCVCFPSSPSSFSSWGKPFESPSSCFSHVLLVSQSLDHRPKALSLGPDRVSKGCVNVWWGEESWMGCSKAFSLLSLPFLFSFPMD